MKLSVVPLTTRVSPGTMTRQSSPARTPASLFKEKAEASGSAHEGGATDTPLTSGRGTPRGGTGEGARDNNNNNVTFCQFHVILGCISCEKSNFGEIL